MRLISFGDDPKSKMPVPPTPQYAQPYQPQMLPPQYWQQPQGYSVPQQNPPPTPPPQAMQYQPQQSPFDQIIPQQKTVCKYCGKTMTTEKKLRQHIGMAHTDQLEI